MNKKILFTMLFLIIASLSCATFSYSSSKRPIQYELEKNEIYEVLWNLQNIGINNLNSKPSIINWRSKFFYQVTDYNMLGLNTGQYLVALNGETGEIQWKTRLDKLSDGFIISNNGAVIRGTNGVSVVEYYDAKDGSLVWKKILPAHSIIGMNYVENKLFIQTNDNQVFILSEEGEVIDNYEDGKISYLLTENLLIQYLNYELNAIDLNSNKTMWRLYLSGDKEIKFSPILDGNDLFVSTKYTPSDIYSTNINDGSINWTVSYDVLSNLCVMDDFIYFLTYDGYLISIDKKTGEEQTKLKFNHPFNTEQSDFYISGHTQDRILVIVFENTNQLMALKVKTLQ